ncbi:Abnormal spindle protein [Fasciola hepatica]|uniref:Abnormal spindle protein n=1 Tax=Fasciola hepatica TaxID=6192 RepID=A0A4E0RF26_FASHE|nr:Abnormal spindle protein [Fasciola hepatica]
MNSKELGFKSELEELRAMEPKVQRKSWFCASPTFVRIKPPGPLDPIGESGFMKSQMTADERDLEVILASNENEVPTTVVASDILTLTTFSRRAVIDFGVVSITGRPIKRYLLLENPHEEDQTVVIQCGLPSNEFSLDWVGSKSTRSQQRIPLSGCSVTLDDPNVTVVRANQGRSLLQVTWIPSASGGSVGFHHTVKFHVNGAYPLQAWVIGRFCVPPSEKVSRFKNPKRVLQGQATMLSSAHTPIGLPSWTNTSFHRVNTLTTQSRHAGAHVSNSSVKTSAFSSALTANNSVPNSALKQRSLSHDRVLNPIHSVHKNLVDFDLREQWQSQIDMPCLLSTQNLEEQLVALERQKALLSSALTFQRIQSTSDLHVQCKISAPSTTQPTSHGFAPPGPSSQRPKRTVPRSNDWSELDQFTRTTLRRSSSVGGLNTSFSRREVPQPSSNTDLTLINATAIGFLSPQLVRSPVLRGDPVLLTTESVKQKTTTVTHESNLFHPDFSHTLSEVSEHGLTQWLNSVFAPCITANAAVCHTHATNNYLTDVCTPGTSTYLVAVSRAVHLLRSSTIVGPGQRVEREVDEGKIIPTVDLSFSADKGAQRRLLDQIIANYAPVWLHLAVDALSSTTIHTQIQQENDLEATGPCVTLPNRATGPTVPLSKKLHFYVFKVTVGGKTLGSAREKTYSTTKNTQEAVKSRGIQPTLKPARKLSRELIHNRFVVKRFLILVWFLDRLKSNRLIKYDPCLFREKSHIKSSSESLLQFARNFLTGENNLVRHLATLGARVEIVQTPLDEYRLTVTNLAVDLRDGIRLVKLAELLIPTLPQNDSMKRRLSSNRTDVSNLMSLVRFPAISRLQKIHNVGLALKAFEESGRVCMPDGSRIDPRDIVDGHHEKCLTLLWCLLLRYQVLALVDEALLDGEIALLKGEIASNDSDRIAHRIREIERAKESVPVHTKLLHWAALVGHIYGLQISNLDESFADGRALCFLVHHYLPTVIPKGLIRQLTTSTVVDKFCSHIPAEQLARNNRYNLLLFERKLSFLGDMPVLLSPTPLRDLPHILPPGLVLATLAYLASRLVLVSKARQQLVDLVRDHAARILQGAWRRLQHRRELEQMRWLSPSKGKQFKTPYLSEKAKKSIFGTPTSPAMQQFFNSRPSRPPASISPVTNSEDSRIQAVVCLQAAVRGFLTRRRLQADLLLASRDRAATCIQRAFRLHREKNKVDRALTYHQAATQIQRQWRKYAIWRRRQHEASASSVSNNNYHEYPTC